MKKSFVIHPFLFALFPILFLYSKNIYQVSFSQALVPSAIVLGFTLLLVSLSGLILRDSKKAGIMVSLFLVLFFSYGHAYELKKIGSFVIDRHRYLLPIWGIFFTCGVYLIIRTHRDLRNFTNILNVMAFSLVVISFTNIEVYEFKIKGKGQDNRRNTVARKNDKTDLGNSSTLRDIYYIVLDGYASSSTLKDVYNFDNTEFSDYLIGQGFYIASKSHSNYAMTFLSLSSSLNMEYINYLHETLGVESTDRRATYQMIKDSKVMHSLKSRGYKFIHFSSGWGATGGNNNADWDIKCGSESEFLMMLIQTTMLNPLQGYLIGNDARARVLCTFSKLAEVSGIKGPKFVFAHIVCPHPPFLFGANGEPVSETVFKMSGDVWQQKENYLNQLIFVSRKVEMLVDEILSKSEVAPIIILQADHGPASTFVHKDSWNFPTKKMLRERMEIFNAYHLPSDAPRVLYDSITPVNTFRLIFKLYFDADYALLNDQSYFSSYERPYEFSNVTDMLEHD